MTKKYIKKTIDTSRVEKTAMPYKNPPKIVPEKGKIKTSPPPKKK